MTEASLTADPPRICFACRRRGAGRREELEWLR